MMTVEVCLPRRRRGEAGNGKWQLMTVGAGFMTAAHRAVLKY